MEKRAVYLLSFVWSMLFLMCSLAVTVQAQIGKDYLDLADNYCKVANFPKALEFVEKAIPELQEEATAGNVEYRLLAKAHYLKAKILCAQGISSNEIEKELLNALLADLDYKPPESYINHPTIAQLLRKAMADYSGTIQAAFTKAQLLFIDEKFCKSLAILKPIATKCKNPKLAMKYVRASEEKCHPHKPTPAPAAPVPDSPSPQPGPAKKIMGVFPVIYKDYYKDNKDRRVTGLLTKEKILAELTGNIRNIEFVLVSSEKADALKTEHKFKEYGEFIVRKWKTYVYIPTAKELIQGKSPESVIGGLTSSKRHIVKRIGEQEGLDYLLFVRVRNPVSNADDLNINMDFNIYKPQSPKQPIISKTWKNLSERRFLKNKNRKIRKILQKYMDEHEL